MMGKMIIDSSNVAIGNRAMAAVLLLYYHLRAEGGVTHDQTVYLTALDFNGFDFWMLRFGKRRLCRSIRR